METLEREEAKTRGICFGLELLTHPITSVAHSNQAGKVWAASMNRRAVQACGGYVMCQITLQVTEPGSQPRSV